MPRKQKPASPHQILVTDKNRCHFTTIDGRQCRMYRAKGHRTLCLTHAQQEEQILDAEAVAKELIGPVNKFQTALELNQTLGNLFTLVAQKRISRLDGALLGFLGQLIHNNIGSTLRGEMRQAEHSNTPPYWEDNVRRALAHLKYNMAREESEPSPAPPEPRPESRPAFAPSGPPPRATYYFPPHKSQAEQEEPEPDNQS
jgi:hypothetical protein